MKPLGWPRYMVPRKLAGGKVGYYWVPTARDRKAGCAMQTTALGSDYAEAKAHADKLNAALDGWRKGTVTVVENFGTVDWWLATYRVHQSFKKLRPSTKKSYERAMSIISALPFAKAIPGVTRVGQMPVKKLTKAVADKIYERLVVGRGKHHEKRLRQAAKEIIVLKKAYAVGQRIHEETGLFAANPFDGVEMYSKLEGETKTPATMEEAYALAEALREMGQPNLGGCALICFEFFQRPENVLDGAIKWGDYEPGRRIKIRHWKTGREMWMDLADAEGPLFPEFEAYMASVPRLGTVPAADGVVPLFHNSLPWDETPIVMLAPRRKKNGEAQPPELWKHRYAHAVVARARKKAGLPDHVTLAACRHGGATELGEAELTETQGMSLTGHSTASAYRLYAKRTAKVRQRAARKRRAYRASEEA